MVDDDAVDLVGDVLERIRDSLEVLEHLPRDGELERIGRALSGMRASDPSAWISSALPSRLTSLPVSSCSLAPLALTLRSSGTASAVTFAASQMSPTMSFISGRSSCSS